MSDNKQPLSTLRGRLRKVVGTLEVLHREMESIFEAADKGGNLDEWGNGCPNERDHMAKLMLERVNRVEALRKQIRQFLSRSRRPISRMPDRAPSRRSARQGRRRRSARV